MSPVKHPGILLADNFLTPLKISPEEFAQRIQLPVGRAESLLSGSEPMTADWALRIERLLGTPARWWLEHQNRCDRQGYSRRDELEDIQPLKVAKNVLLTPSGILAYPTMDLEIKPESREYSEDFVKMLEAQVALRGDRPRPLGVVEEVVYKNGARALVGKRFTGSEDDEI